MKRKLKEDTEDFIISLEKVTSFIEVAEKGELEKLQSLIDSTSDSERFAMIHAKKNEAFVRALENQHVKVLHLLIFYTRKNESSEDSLFYKVYEYSDALFRIAARNGDIESLQLLIELHREALQRGELSTEVLNDTMEVYNSAFDSAVYYGRPEVSKFLLDRIKEEEESAEAFILREFFKVAVERGRLDVLEYLIRATTEQSKHLLSQMIFEAFQVAAEYGSLDIFKCLINYTTKGLKDSLSQMIFEAFKVAAEYGSLNILKYIVSIVQFGNVKSICEPDSNYPHNINEYLLNLKFFVESVQTNNLNSLDVLLGIVRRDHEIVNINEEGDITLGMINKAIKACQYNNAITVEFIASLIKISEYIVEQKKLRMQSLEAQLMTRNITGYLDFQVMEQAPTPILKMGDDPSLQSNIR